MSDMNEDLKRLAAEIAKAKGLTLSKLGLRFDKVAMRVLHDLETCADQALPMGQVLIVTHTAPILEASKTTDEIKNKIAKMVTTKSFGKVKRSAINGNQISLLILKVPATKKKMFGFVHNPTTDAKMLIGLAKEWIRESERRG